MGAIAQYHLELCKMSDDDAAKMLKADQAWRTLHQIPLAPLGGLTFAEHEQQQKQGGRKDDTGKPAYHLIAPEMLEALAVVLEFGARKYEPRNWEKGMSWSRCFGALMRHMWAWWHGEGVDQETGLSHLWHAACCLMFLLAYEARGVGDDDRPT